MEDCLEWLLLDEDEKRLEAGLERPEDVQEVVGVKRHRGDSLISRVMGPGGPECLISGGPSAAIFFVWYFISHLCVGTFLHSHFVHAHTKRKNRIFHPIKEKQVFVSFSYLFHSHNNNRKLEIKIKFWFFHRFFLSFFVLCFGGVLFVSCFKECR